MSITVFHIARWKTQSYSIYADLKQILTFEKKFGFFSLKVG